MKSGRVKYGSYEAIVRVGRPAGNARSTRNNVGRWVGLFRFLEKFSRESSFETSETARSSRRLDPRLNGQ